MRYSGRMSQSKKTANQPRAFWILAAQASVILIGMGLTLTPVPGETALYMPLFKTSEAQMLQWSEAHGLKLANRGPLDGTLLVTGSDLRGALQALGDGALLIAAPSALCGAPESRRSSAR